MVGVEVLIYPLRWNEVPIPSKYFTNPNIMYGNVWVLGSDSR